MKSLFGTRKRSPKQHWFLVVFSALPVLDDEQSTGYYVGHPESTKPVHHSGIIGTPTRDGLPLSVIWTVAKRLKIDSDATLIGVHYIGHSTMEDFTQDTEAVLESIRAEKTS
jgi:hypothetical protein